MTQILLNQVVICFQISIFEPLETTSKQFFRTQIEL